MEKAVETIQETTIPGVLLIERPIYPDNRGFFREVVRLDELDRFVVRDLLRFK